MIWFHIPLKSHWQMPLVNSPMAGFQTSSPHPLLPLTELPLLHLMLIYSAVFLPVAAWVKGRAFIDGCYGNTWKLKISLRNHCVSQPPVIPSPSLLPETNWLPNLAVWKRMFSDWHSWKQKARAAQVLFCYSAWKIYPGTHNTNTFPEFFFLDFEENGAKIWGKLQIFLVPNSI